MSSSGSSLPPPDTRHFFSLQFGARNQTKRGAAGCVYLPGRNGVTVVLKQSDKLEVLDINRLDEKFDASPAAVGKDLFLRGREHRYCITEK